MQSGHRYSFLIVFDIYYMSFTCFENINKCIYEAAQKVLDRRLLIVIAGTVFLVVRNVFCVLLVTIFLIVIFLNA